MGILLIDIDIDGITLEESLVLFVKVESVRFRLVFCMYERYVERIVVMYMYVDGSDSCYYLKSENN